MSRTLAPAPVRLYLWSGLGLVLLYGLAPWPLLQTVVHAALVIGVAPAFGGSLATALLAAAAGWTVETSLHLYPRLGGTPLADMIVALTAHGMRYQWPPEHRGSYLLRLALLCLGHALLAHLLVRWAAGPHAWGWGWLLAFVTVPLWGSLAFSLVQAPARK